jgi:hypothetical protein
MSRVARRAAVLAVAGLAALAAPAVAALPTPTAHDFGHTQTSVTVGFSIDPAQAEGVEGFVITNGTRTWESPIWDQWWETLTDLPTNQTHTFTVRTRDAAGNLSAASNPVSVFIENQPPTAPRNVRQDGDRLVWDASNDNSGKITHYTIRANGAFIRATRDLFGPLTGWDPIEGRPIPGPGTHTYTVTAKDPSGNESAPSDPVTVVIR